MQNKHAGVSDEDVATLQVGEAANLLGVHPDTLKRWERAGHIAAQRTPTGHRRFRRADVDALRERMAAGAAS